MNTCTAHDHLFLQCDGGFDAQCAAVGPKGVHVAACRCEVVHESPHFQGGFSSVFVALDGRGALRWRT